MTAHPFCGTGDRDFKATTHHGLALRDLDNAREEVAKNDPHSAVNYLMSAINEMIAHERAQHSTVAVVGDVLASMETAAERIQRLPASAFTVEELNWVLRLFRDYARRLREEITVGRAK